MFSIGAIAQQTGIDISTLRKWESRYGFPVPQRTPAGHRVYSPADLAALHEIARQLAAGARPGAVIKAFVGERPSAEPMTSARVTDVLMPGVDSLRDLDVSGLRCWLEAQAAQRDAVDFVETIAAPFARQVGVLWGRGQLPVFAEHLFSSLLEQCLVIRYAQPRPALQTCSILLTAPSGELHVAGLSMAAAVLSELGATVIRLPADLPTNEIVAAAQAFNVAAVGLTASPVYSPRLLKAGVMALRRQLPAEVSLWLGGAGMAQLPAVPPDSQLITQMPKLVDAYRAVLSHHRH